ncbi:MAG: glycosyltransferase family 1 protein, partial [Flavobacterium sp.]
TTNSGVFPEAGGPDSIYVNEYDVEQISDAISTLLKDETTRLQIAEQGRVYAQKFNDEQIAKHWNNLYTKILE